MKRLFLFFALALVVIFASSCSQLLEPAQQPQLSATDFPAGPTAMSEFPPTWTVNPTEIPSPTRTRTPTPLPLQSPINFKIALVMGADEILYPQQHADRNGWTLVEGETGIFSIPTNFVVMDIAEVFMEMMFGMMENFAEGFIEFSDGFGEELDASPQETPEPTDLDEMPELDFVIAMEDSTNSAIIMVNVDRTPETTTQDLLDEALSGSSVEFHIEGRELYINSPFPMERVILDVVDEELGELKQVIYVILGDEMGWNLVFTTPPNLIKAYLPLFESVVDSFTPIQ
jgi:hypothetical protein